MTAHAGTRPSGIDKRGFGLIVNVQRDATTKRDRQPRPEGKDKNVFVLKSNIFVSLMYMATLCILSLR